MGSGLGVPDGVRPSGVSMAIGKIASLFSSLSPASDAAAASSADEVPEQRDRRTEAASEQASLADRERNGDPNAIAAQLQTMVSAVRTLNENAIQQGAAVAVSAAGTELRNAVGALSHLLAAVDAQALAHGAAAPAKEAAVLMDAVEAGLAGTQTATEQVLRNLPATQAARAQELADRFQAEMRGAIRRVRNVLSDLNVKG